MALLYHVANTDAIPPTDSFDSLIGAECRDFISQCLVRDPRERWSAAQLSTHPFVAARKAAAASPQGEGDPLRAL